MQYNINVANGTGMEVRTNLNLAHQSLATNFFGATDPSLMSPVCAFPGSTWADTGNGLLKVRKADNSDWIVIGTIKSDGTPKLGENAINTSELALNLRQPSTKYAVGDIAYSALLPSWAYIECTVGGTTSSGDLPVPSSVVANATFVDGTVTWKIRKVGTDFPEYTKTINAGMFNTKEVLETSGTYTVPVTGWYRITTKGGGGGGGGACNTVNYALSGGGGGEGGIGIGYTYMATNDSVSVTVGAGGTGGTSGTTATAGGNGGSSAVYVNSVIVCSSNGGSGGEAGNSNSGGGAGGGGTIAGAPGGVGLFAYLNQADVRVAGGHGGGNGGGKASMASSVSGIKGSGGSGGVARVSKASSVNGGAGGNGYVMFEYYNPSLNP